MHSPHWRSGELGAPAGVKSISITYMEFFCSEQWCLLPHRRMYLKTHFQSAVMNFSPVKHIPASHPHNWPNQNQGLPIPSPTLPTTSTTAWTQAWENKVLEKSLQSQSPGWWENFSSVYWDPFFFLSVSVIASERLWGKQFWTVLEYQILKYIHIFQNWPSQCESVCAYACRWGETKK